MYAHMAARSTAPWMLLLALILLAVLALLVGLPAEDVGSWRWSALRAA